MKPTGGAGLSQPAFVSIPSLLLTRTKNADFAFETLSICRLVVDAASTQYVTFFISIELLYTTTLGIKRTWTNEWTNGPMPNGPMNGPMDQCPMDRRMDQWTKPMDHHFVKPHERAYVLHLG